VYIDPLNAVKPQKMSNLQVVLTINEQPKEIPYPPASNAFSQNFGFRVLKGNLDKIESIQEAEDSECIRRFLRSLNSGESPFFSVGCEKSFNQDTNGYWAKGYIEFAFNYRKLVSDATHYFPLFFHFNRYIADYIKERDVQFWWELQPARFKAANCDGFSCCIWITTGYFQSPDEARNIWESAISMLRVFVEGIMKPDAEPIYR